MANSGITRTFFNYLERLLSADLNKVETDLAAALLDVWYAMYGWNRTDAGAAPGTPSWQRVELPVTAEPATGPLKSVVLAGLLANPQATALLVDEGALVTVQPGAAGESRAVLARSTGVSDTATFPFVANAGAGPRWDILECRPRTSDTTATRDIWDPVSKTFDGQEVQKTTVTDLEFRYRTGTAGSPAAPPTIEAGWQPLCALWVPNTAASFDDVELFDVRPVLDGLEAANSGRVLMNGLSFQQNDVSSQYRNKLGTTGSAPTITNTYSTVGSARIVGLIQAQFDASALPGYSIFGAKGYSAEFPLQATNPGTTLEGVSPDFLGDAASVGGLLGYGVNGTTWQANQRYSFGVMFPFGLARWHKYANAGAAIAGRRWPALQPGIMFVLAGGNPLGPVSVGMPLVYDTNVSDQYGIVLGWVESGTTLSGTQSKQTSSQGYWDGWYNLGNPVEKSSDTGSGLSQASWDSLVVGDGVSNLPCEGLLYEFFVRTVMNGTAGEITGLGSLSVYNGSTRTSDGSTITRLNSSRTTSGVARGASDIIGSFVLPIFTGAEAITLLYGSETHSSDPQLRIRRANLKKPVS